MKPWRSNRCASDKIYHGARQLSLILGLFPRNPNRFHFRTIFTIKRTFCWTVTKTGPLRGAPQTKQCLYIIPCDCDRAEIHMKVAEMKFDLKSARKFRSFRKWGSRRPQNLLKRKFLQIKPNSSYRRYKALARVSRVGYPDSQFSPGCRSHLYSRPWSGSQKIMARPV
jgi:hypothetical protein